MNSETKNCQDCKKDFVIESEDFNFYEKIKVPPPTFCPECRMVRRMLWRNARSLFKRECAGCKKSLISMYPLDKAPVYCTECWNDISPSLFLYGKEYNFSKPFFEQLKELFEIAPRFYAYKFGNLINSEFTNYSKDNKNVYLSYSVTGCEDVSYCEYIDKAKNSMDCFGVEKIDGCSYNINCEGNYNTHYALKSNSCIDSYFIFDCLNCSDCCLSSNLRNQQYVFKNQKLSKEEYEKSVRELNMGSNTSFENAKEYFDYMVSTGSLHKYAFSYSSQNSNGDYIHNVQNVKNCFDTSNARNVSYGNRVIEVDDSYDLSGVGFKAELIYESMAATANTYKDFFCYITIQGCRECQYSMILKNCSNCFGCVGLTNASYCVLNKQYTKEEYEELISKIIKQMSDMPYVDKKGRVFKYGEFFPYDMSPFSYNSTNAYDFFPISKEEAFEFGYNWKDREKRNYQITKIFSELPDDIKDVNDDILNETIACLSNGDQKYQCSTAFKIMPNDLQFYRQKNLPLPRYCPNCRHYQRLKYRNPLRLYKRQCMCDKNNHGHNKICEEMFDTTYPLDRSEKIYCDKCYKKEVY